MPWAGDEHTMPEICYPFNGILLIYKRKAFVNKSSSIHVKTTKKFFDLRTTMKSETPGAHILGTLEN